MDEINIQDSSINKKSNNKMSVILFMGATFVKKNSCLIARIVSFHYFPYFRAIPVQRY